MSTLCQNYLQYLQNDSNGTDATPYPSVYWCPPIGPPESVSDACRGVLAIWDAHQQTGASLGLVDGRIADAVNAAKHISSQCKLEFTRARGRVNRYEGIGKGPPHCRFINRSAIKMANMNGLFRLNELCDRSIDRFTFVDLCGGPGGFCEYFLRTFQAKHILGFAMSLVIDANSTASSCNWDLDHMHDPPHTAVLGIEGDHIQAARKLFILDGVDGTGDLFLKANVDYLCEFVHSKLSVSDCCDGYGGVDFVCGDGGSGEGRDREDQELVMLPLLICQVVAMLGVLRKGGDFVLKTFTMHQPITVGMVHLLSQLFDKIAIVKPVSSRPTSSERYIYCRNLRHLEREERNHLQNFLWKACGAFRTRDYSLSSFGNSDHVKVIPDCATPLINYIRQCNEALLFVQLSHFLQAFVCVCDEYAFEFSVTDIKNMLNLLSKIRTRIPMDRECIDEDTHDREIDVPPRKKRMLVRNDYKTNYDEQCPTFHCCFLVLHQILHAMNNEFFRQLLCSNSVSSNDYYDLWELY